MSVGKAWVASPLLPGSLRVGEWRPLDIFPSFCLLLTFPPSFSALMHPSRSAAAPLFTSFSAELSEMFMSFTFMYWLTAVCHFKHFPRPPFMLHSHSAALWHNVEGQNASYRRQRLAAAAGLLCLLQSMNGEICSWKMDLGKLKPIEESLQGSRGSVHAQLNERVCLSFALRPRAACVEFRRAVLIHNSCRSLLLLLSFFNPWCSAAQMHDTR